MPDGVLLDTSFLITFADPTRKHHAVARQYFDFFVEAGVPMFLSTIVASEFGLVQPVTDLPLDALIVLPFNLADASCAAELDFRKYKGTPETTRAAIKDDFKLLGQAKARQLAFLLTEDARTLSRYCEELHAAGKLPTRAIKLSDGFDKSYFNPTRQRDFDDAIAPLSPDKPPPPPQP